MKELYKNEKIQEAFNMMEKSLEDVNYQDADKLVKGALRILKDEIVKQDQEMFSRELNPLMMYFPVVEIGDDKYGAIDLLKYTVFTVDDKTLIRNKK
jgi:hypothetical protein